MVGKNLPLIFKNTQKQKEGRAKYKNKTKKSMNHIGSPNSLFDVASLRLELKSRV